MTYVSPRWLQEWLESAHVRIHYPKLRERYLTAGCENVALAEAKAVWLIEQQTAGIGRKPDPPPKSANGRRPKVDDRMKAELAANFETVKGWTAQQWANHLGCVKSTVIATPMWKSLALLRQQVKAEKRRDRDRHGAAPGTKQIY